MVAEQALVVGEEPALADGRRGLQLGHEPGPFVDAQDVLAAGDGAARDEHHAAPPVHQLRDVGDDAGEQAPAEAQAVVGHGT